MGVCGIIAIKLFFSRTNEFCNQAKVGQPIVHAIEQFRRQEGRYPKTLAELVPEYLPAEPNILNKDHGQYAAWEYSVITNGNNISFKLRCYMGRGGIEYDPPNWIGDNEGHKEVLLK